MGMRRRSREVALMTLYSLEFNCLQRASVNSLLAEYENALNDICNMFHLQKASSVYKFSNFLVKNTLLHFKEINRWIEKYSKNWKLERLAVVDRNILRIGVFEIVYTDTPHQVIICEALEIAKKFSSDNAHKFINGVLDAIAHTIRK